AGAGRAAWAPTPASADHMERGEVQDAVYGSRMRPRLASESRGRSWKETPPLGCDSSCVVTIRAKPCLGNITRLTCSQGTSRRVRHVVRWTPSSSILVRVRATHQANATGRRISQPRATGYAETGQAIARTSTAMTMYDIGLTRKRVGSAGVDSGTGCLNEALMMTPVCHVSPSGSEFPRVDDDEATGLGCFA